MRLASSITAASVFVTCMAADVASAQSPPPPACTAAEHRQFDFWLGEWEVTAPNGNVAGTSLNAYDASSGRWHQTWIGSDGVLLLLDGAFRAGTMELSGVTVGRDGAKTHHRIRWTTLPGSPARLRQLWESSTDGGKTWAVAFDGTYQKR